jgi:hypothetical protein
LNFAKFGVVGAIPDKPLVPFVASGF